MPGDVFLIVNFVIIRNKKVLKNIETLKFENIRNYENFKIDTHSFCDDCFNDHPSKVILVFKMLLKLSSKVEWISYARADVAAKYPEQLS